MAWHRVGGSQRGISLIEAVVALGVMAFGILGVAGIQASLRASSDISKQRAEASRLAQQIVEDRRNYLSLQATGDANVLGYADIGSATLSAVTGTNASFTRTVVITDSTAGQQKFVQATVQWTDRAGTTQSVQLLSAINKVAPEVAASVGIPPTSATGRLPQGRSLQIPRRAVNQGDGTSIFTPPGGGSVRWVFSNTSGIITKLCSTPSTCVDVNARLLAGYIRFAVGSTQPTTANTESPTDNGPNGIGVEVQQTSPTAQTVSCYEDDQGEYVAYYCAVPVTDATPKWSGRSVLTGITLASSISSTSASQYKVCRYTTTRAQDIVPTNIGNADHPLDYLDLDVGLQNQNFFVMRAGNGTSAFTCPADDTSTPLVNGNTWHHQPSS